MNLVDDIRNGTRDSGRRIGRTPELRRRNRIVVTILVVVALTLFALAIYYIMYYGGTNKGPLKPLHSSVMMSDHGGIS